MKKIALQLALSITISSWFFTSCGPALDMKNIHTSAVPEANDSTSWHYDEKENNIVMPSYKGGDVVLNLNGYLLVDNPKSGVPVASSPLAEPDPKKGAYSRPLKVNGNTIIGTLVGKYKDQIVLEAHFEMGRRCGSFFGITNAGKEYKPSGAAYSPCMSDMQVRKPVIYLYPTTTETVNVQVEFKGALTHTYPKYPQNGWTVEAKPSGELKDTKTGKIYYQLFWEGASQHVYNMDKGFVVKGSETAEFLDDKLAALGLNRREANEFITYWLPELEQNAYNFIHFSTSEYEQQAQLNVQPNPDTQIRVFMVYQPLQQWREVSPQVFKTPTRKGFTLVEWGGMKQQENIN